MLLINKKSPSYVLLSVFLVFGFLGCSSKNHKQSEYDYSNVKYDVNDYGTNVGNMKNSKAMHRATMRPYEVFGKKYYPTLAKIGDTSIGISSWYGPNFHTKKTSNGETYNMYASTAAHKTLPMNTMLKVYNLENGKTTIVRINDRGPFVGARILDLSNKAAKDISMINKGTAKVKITVIGFNGKTSDIRLEKAEIVRVNEYYVQVGAFREYEGARLTHKKFTMIVDNNYDVKIKEDIYDDVKMHRVLISGFRSHKEAFDYKNKNGLETAMIVAK